MPPATLVITRPDRMRLVNFATHPDLIPLVDCAGRVPVLDHIPLLTTDLCADTACQTLVVASSGCQTAC